MTMEVGLERPERGANIAWPIIFVATIGPFITQLDSTLVNVSLASLAAEFHTDLSTIHWVTSAYLLALALMLPLSGWMVDRIGAKAVYLVCFSAFSIASALCAAAWSSQSLILFRILQGLSGGLLAPMAQMMMARAAGAHMSRVMGFAAIPILLGPLLGPVVAGTILQFASWRWLFLMTLPIGALGVGLAALILPDDREERQPRDFDLTGFVLLSPGLVLFLYSTDHLTGAAGLAALIGSVILLSAFVRRAMVKGASALVDLRLFRRREFSAAVIIQFFSNGINFSGQMLVPLFLMQACRLSPSEAGMLLSPLGIGLLCSYPLVGLLTERFGARAISASGAVVALTGTLILWYLAIQGLVPVILAGALFLRGAGMSAIGIPSVSAAYSSVERSELAMASTTLNIIQRLGGPVLTALCAAFLSWRLGAQISDAFADVFALLSVTHFILLVATLRMPLSSDRPIGTVQAEGESVA